MECLNIMKYLSDMKEKVRIASVNVVCKRLQGMKVLSVIEMECVLVARIRRLKVTMSGNCSVRALKN